MSRVMIPCLAVLLVMGCKSQEKSVRGAFPAPKATFEVTAKTNVHRIIDTPDPGAVIEAPEVVEEEPAAKEVVRDLATELQQALGSPVDCLMDFEANSPMKVQIPINATVRPTGMIIQPTVGGVGLSIKERECVAHRVTFVKLEPLDKPFSQPVSTFVQFDYVPPVIVESEPVPDPKLKNVKEPLAKRPEVAPSGRPIQAPKSRPITDPASKDPSGPSGRPITGPKPRAIDGYEVDENAQQWR